MEFSDAVNIVKTNYSAELAAKLIKLSEDAVVILAKECQNNSRINLSDASIDRLMSMGPDRQCGYLVNPLLEFFMDRAMAQIMGGALNSGTASSSDSASTTTTTATGKVPEKKPEVKPEPIPDDDVAPFDLFG